MYIKHCKLTRYQQSRLLEYFVAGTPTKMVANLVGMPVEKWNINGIDKTFPR